MRERRIDPSRGERIAISGVGRSGTTFLVQLFTALKFDTGFSLGDATRGVDAISSAGLERPLVAADNPYVIKSPWFHETLAEALASGAVKLSWMIIPMRELFAAAESRRRVFRAGQQAGMDPRRQAGSLWMTDQPAEQEDKLARIFYGLIADLVRYQVPMIFLAFPRLVEDAGYCFECLAPLLAEHGVSRQEFLWAHAAVARPDLVHAFPPGGVLTNAPTPAIRRNDPCPCGSGKKFKHCHGAL